MIQESELEPRLSVNQQCGVWGGFILAATGVILLAMGREPWCKCGQAVPFSWDIWSQHNSQHLIDPYFFTHVLHGIIFYGMLRWLWKSGSVTNRFVMAVLLESAWEVLENTPLVIERYRTVTMSLDYYGDSVANSLMDVIACAVGFGIAYRLKSWQSVAIIAATELALLLTIRDCLALNVLMLISPIEAVKEWQMGA